MIRSVAIVVVLFFLHLSFGDELYEGDACQVSRSGAPGTCKTLNNCPEAVKEFDQGGKPAHCGWSGVIEIICCKNPPRPKPTIVKVDRVSTRSRSIRLTNYLHILSSFLHIDVNQNVKSMRDTPTRQPM